MNIKRFFILVILLIAGFTSQIFLSQGYAAEKSHQHSAKTVYICPMHPQITSDRKGSCPICGMDLVKKEKEEEAPPVVLETKDRKILFYRNPMNPSVTSPVPTKDSMGMDCVPVYEEEKGAPQGVPINTSKQQMIGVRKNVVMKRPLAVDIFTVGKVAYDPDLYVAQEEYIQAVKTAAATEKSALVSIREQSAGLLVSAERKLLLLGMNKSEIETLKRSEEHTA